MLNSLNQPKGSTIGVLRDGRTVQEAFDSLMYTEVLLKTGKENAESNRAALQAAAAVLQFPTGTLVRPSSQYAIKVTAKCSSGSETLTFAGVANGVGQTSVSMQLSTEPTSATTQFTSGSTQSGFSLGRSSNGADIEILAIEFIKLYSLEYSVVADTGATTIYRGSGDVVISASGNLQFPAYVVLRYIGGSLKEVYKSVTDAAVIDITWSVSGQTLTVNITGSGGGKRFSVTQEEV